MAYHPVNTAAFGGQSALWVVAGLNPAGVDMAPSWVAMLDIGQGSTCAVFNTEGRVIVYYDFGGGAGSNRFTFPDEIAGSLGPRYCSAATPLFLLSHWDWDHWRGIVPAIGSNSPVQLAGNPLSPVVGTGTWAAKTQPMGALNLAARTKIHTAPTHFYERTTVGAPVFHTFGHFHLILCNGGDVNNNGFALRITDPVNAGQYMLLSGDATYTNIPAHGAAAAVVSIGAKHHGDEIAAASIPAPLVAGVGVRTVGYSFGAGNKYGHPRTAGLGPYTGLGYLVRKQTSGMDGTFATAGPRGNLVLPFNSTPLGPGIPAAAAVAAYNAAGVATMASATKAAFMAVGAALTVQFGHAVSAAVHEAITRSGHANAVPWAAQVAAAPVGLLVQTPMETAAIALGPPSADLLVALAAANAACGPLAAAQARITAIADLLTLAHSTVANSLSATAAGGFAWWAIGRRSARATRLCYAATADVAGEIAPLAGTLGVPAGVVLGLLPAPPPPLPVVASIQSLAAHAAFRSARLAMGRSAANAESPPRAASSIYAYLTGLALPNVSNELCAYFAAGAALLPHVPISPENGAQPALTVGQQTIVRDRLSVAIAGAHAAMANAAANHAQCVTVAVAAARAARGAVAGLPQPGCHRHPVTCAGNCSLTMHY